MSVLRKSVCGVALCVLCTVFLFGSAAFADQETYTLEGDMIYRIDKGGERTLLKEEQPGRSATDSGVFSWILVDPELSDAMAGSESGIYFFDESGMFWDFLPLEGAAYCDVSFSPDGERFLISRGTDVSQTLFLYTFADMKRQVVLDIVAPAVWMDFARFVFTLDDGEKGRRGDALDQQKGWLSVMVYDTLMEEVFPVAEATETTDYMLLGIDFESGNLEIGERSVEDVEDWNHEEKILDRNISVPMPAAG